MTVETTKASKSAAKGESKPDPLADLRRCLDELTPEQLREMQRGLDPETERELKERLRPFETPVTEETMRRSTGS